jgi:radical SAM superfamily enzyme YgiQ (UPF0313 family)
MTRIGFVFPSSDYLFDPFRGDPHTHFQILTVLEDHFGSTVDLKLIDLRAIKPKFAIYHIPECDVYLYSVYTLDYEEQVNIVGNLRKRYPRAKHIAGGPHAVIFKEQSLQTFDSLVIGDGEDSIIQAINDIRNGEPKKVYEQINPIDINRFPYPLRKYIPESAVARKGLLAMKTKKGYEQLLSTTVMFSRGCPYRCSFCAMPQLSKVSPGIRYRDPQLIEAEIEYLKRDYKIQAISLLDDISIPHEPKRASAHLDALGRTGIIWKGQSRIDGITPNLAKMARNAGCVALGMGVESVSQRSLDIVNKKIHIRQAGEAISVLKQAGIESRIYLIIGLPGEPEDIVDESWKFIQEAQPDMVYLSVFTVRPGTEVFNNPAKFGIKHVHTDWGKSMHLFGRYEKEVPTLTFEYNEVTPWGKGFTTEMIINNYHELQTRIKEGGLSSAITSDVLI